MDTPKRYVPRVESIIFLVIILQLGCGHASEVRSYQEPAEFMKDSEIKLVIDTNTSVVDETGGNVLVISIDLICQNGTVTNVITTEYYKKEKSE